MARAKEDTDETVMKLQATARAYLQVRVVLVSLARYP